MSRIGKLPIKIPKDVNIKYNGSSILVEGKFGSIKRAIPEEIEVIINDYTLDVKVKETIKNCRSSHGLYRTLINNMVIGVSEQFELTLILKGVGYRASVIVSDIILNLGYSHQIKIPIPTAISVQIAQNTIITLKSCNKELLGEFGANIRSWRRPEPYKGKGVLYKDEQILRKAGKSGK